MTVQAHLALGLSYYEDPLEGREFWREINEGCWNQDLLRQMLKTSRWVERNRHRIPSLEARVDRIDERRRGT